MILNYFEVKDLQEIFSVGKTTVYFWMRKGWLPRNKLSISNIYTIEDLEKLVEILPKYRKELQSLQSRKG